MGIKKWIQDALPGLEPEFREPTFVGDSVRVSKLIDVDDELDPVTGWYLGRTGQVIDYQADQDIPFKVRFSDGQDLWFFAEELEKRP